MRTRTTAAHRHRWQRTHGHQWTKPDYRCRCGTTTHACEGCGAPMIRYPSRDTPIPDSDGMYEAYRCKNGHYYFEPFD